MPIIAIESAEQYEKAIEVLTQVGGTYQGIGPSDNAQLLVNQRQFEALLAAHVVSSDDKKGNQNGQETRERN